MQQDICIGRICKATAGRGKGRYFMVMGRVGSDYVLLTDGDTRKAAKPKLKKIRHIQCRPYVAEALAARIVAGQLPEDHEIRTQLSRMTATENRKETQLVQE